ncbi:MAG TPA: ArsC family reductase [Gammaproteobacteria bacterium]|nr:ArsC family reductase [Gammaproteobacteria bacterium]
MSNITLYGIKQCDTVKKAQRWLTDHQLAFDFHDLRQDGINNTMLSDWLSHLDWTVLLNKRSTTWRQLASEQQQDLDKESAVALMLAQPTLIKRPVMYYKDHYHVGFSASAYHQLFLS